MSNRMEISQLGNCISLWNNHNNDPRCTMGNFQFNLIRAQKLLSNWGTLSVQILPTVNQYLYVADPDQNPDGKTVYELLTENADIDVVFDPIYCNNFFWDNRTRIDTDTFSSEAARLSIQLMLHANAGLQHQLKERLAAKQLEYLKRNNWTHFRTRVADLWSIANKVCFGEEPKATTYPYDNAQTFIIDSIFLLNKENMHAYVEYLYQTYENTGSTQPSLSKWLDELKSEINKLSKLLDKQKENLDLGQDQAHTILSLLSAMRTTTPDTWYRDFTVLPDREFAVCMDRIQKKLFSALSHKKTPLSSAQASDLTDLTMDIQSQIDQAQAEWQKILSLRKSNMEDAETESVSEHKVADSCPCSETLFNELSRHTGISKELLQSDAELASCAKQEYVRNMTSIHRKRAPNEKPTELPDCETRESNTESNC